MKNLNGGYSMIDLTSSTLVEDLASAYALGKPVLVYDPNGKGNYYTLKENSGAYTLVGADTTINVTSQGVVTSKENSVYNNLIKVNVTALAEGYTKVSGDYMFNYVSKKHLEVDSTLGYTNFRNTPVNIIDTFISDGTNTKSVKYIKLTRSTGGAVYLYDGTEVTITFDSIVVVESKEAL